MLELIQFSETNKQINTYLDEIITISKFMDLYKGSRKKPFSSGYIKSAKGMLVYAVKNNQGVISEALLERYMVREDGTRKSQAFGSMCKRVLKFCKSSGIWQVKADPINNIPPALHEMVFRYQADKRLSGELNEDSARQRVYLLNQFFSFLNVGKENPSFDRIHVIHFLNSLEINTLSANTYLAYLKDFAGWLFRKRKQFNLSDAYCFELMEIRDMKNAKTPKNVQFKDFLTKVERDKLINTTLEHSYENSLMWSLGCFAGLRASEILTLEYEDFDPHTNELWVKGKGYGETKQPVKVFPELLEYLTAWVGKKGRVFKISYSELLNRFHEDTAQTGIQKRKLTPHSMRHTCATLMLEEGWAIQHVQLQLRHSNISTTQKYLVYMQKKQFREKQI